MKGRAKARAETLPPSVLAAEDLGDCIKAQRKVVEHHNI